VDDLAADPLVVVFQISIAADFSWNRGTFARDRVGRSVP
jgi:hypothetical protein